MSGVASKVPQLRFSEFGGAWEKTKLGEKEISNFIKDRVALNQLDIKTYISTENLLPNYSGIKIVTKLPSSGSFIKFKKKDILISNIRPYLKKVWQATINGNSSNDVIVIRAKTKVIDSFLVCILKNDNFIDYVMKNAKGTKMPRGDLSSIKKYSLFYPTKPEQQKIANFLTAVDTKIEQLSKKQALLSAYKKGVMQKIFSQTMRFKADDGREFADWEESKLGDVGEFKTSSVDKKIVEGQKLIQLVNYMNVYKHKNINNASIKDLMTVSANKTQLNSSNLKKGDILFTPSSETPDDIGHSVVIFEDLKDTLYSYHLMRFRPKVKLDILYSHYFCNIPDVLSQISRVATGSTRFTISIGEFSKIQVSLPSLQEQTKIANFLSSIDTKIKQVSKQLDKSKEFKKALLQQMFV